MSPLIFAVTALVAWWLDGDVGAAIWVGACSTAGVMVAVFATKWIAGRE